MRFVIGALVMIFVGLPAQADGFRVVGLNGSDSVFVWRSKQAHDEAMSLVSAGVHRTKPELILPLVACIVPSGTSAIVTDMGFVTHDIMIIEGDSSGCRGNIPMESLKSK